MFHDLILPIVRDRIANDLSLADGEIFCHVDRSVPAYNGRARTITVYPGSMAGEKDAEFEWGIDVQAGFSVGITLRTGVVPEDRMFEVAYGGRSIDGILPTFRKILTCLVRDKYLMQQQINMVIPDPWKLWEPFRYQGNSALIERVGPDHFHADPTTADATRDFGIWLGLELGEGRFAVNLDTLQGVS